MGEHGFSMSVMNDQMLLLLETKTNYSLEIAQWKMNKQWLSADAYQILIEYVGLLDCCNIVDKTKISHHLVCTYA